MLESYEGVITTIAVTYVERRCNNLNDEVDKYGYVVTGIAV